MRGQALASLAIATVVGLACSKADTASSSPAAPAAVGGRPVPPSSTGTPYVEPPPDDGLPKGECTGEAGTLYALSVRVLGGTEDIPLCRFQGRPLLIVNGASYCGFTVQYKPLEALYEKYADKGFYVLGFPSNSFNQEDADAATVSDVCRRQNGITFPLFEVAPVKDAGDAGTAQPVYQWLYAQPDQSTPVAWNFEKFLISKDGKVVKRWLSAVSPDPGSEIDLAIAAEAEK